MTKRRILLSYWCLNVPYVRLKSMHRGLALCMQVKHLLRQDRAAGLPEHCIMAWGCGANCAKLILIIVNIVFLVRAAVPK